MSAPPPPGTICSCIADLQSHVLSSLGGAGRALAGPGTGSERRRPGTAFKTQRTNSVTVGGKRSNPPTPKSQSSPHTHAKPLPTPPGSGSALRKAEVKKPVVERSRSSKLKPAGKEAPAHQDNKARRDCKELMKKIFVQEHETKEQAYWRQHGETWVNSTVRGHLTS